MNMFFKVLLLSLIIMLVSSCNKRESEATPPPYAFLRVTAAPVMSKTLIDTVFIYGSVRLRQEAMLASQFDGRLTDFSWLVGDKVKKGQQLGIIVPPQREALQHILPGLDADQQQLLSEQIKEIPVFSPIGGIVLDVLQHNGDVVQQGEAIVHIADLEQLDVYGDVPITYLPIVQQLKSLQVFFVDYSTEPVSLPIEAIASQVDPAKQTVVVRLALDNRRELYRPGMLARIILPGEKAENVIAIPRAALLEEEGVFSAFVVNGNTVQRRILNIGIQQKDVVQVLSGVKPGDMVVTNKAYSLVDGMEVIVE